MTTHMILADVNASTPQPDAVTRFINDQAARFAAFVAVVDAAPDAPWLRDVLGIDA